MVAFAIGFAPVQFRVLQSIDQLESVCLVDEPDKDRGAKFAYCAAYSIGVVDSWLAVRAKAFSLPSCLAAPFDKLNFVVAVQVKLKRAVQDRTKSPSAAVFVLNTFLEKHPQCGTTLEPE